MQGADIIRTARENLARATTRSVRANLPDAGWRWASYCQKLQQEISTFNNPVEVIHRIQAPQTNAGYEARMTGSTLVEHARVMEEHCRVLFPEFESALPSFAESPLSLPETVCELGGRPVSSALYNLVLHTMRCLSFTRPSRVLEIGGGYGAPGRLWLTNGLHRPSQYIDVDLPESLFYAEVFLRANFSDVPIIYSHGPGDLRSLESPDGARPQIFLCPASEIHLFADVPIDLVTNTGSLQEMTDEFVRFYMDWLDRSKAEFFYSSNYFAQPIDRLMEGMNYAAPVLGPRWGTVFHRLWGDLPS